MKGTEAILGTIGGLSSLLKGKKVSPVELTRAALARIAELNDRVKAFITVTGGEALKAAQGAEKEILAGKYRGPLHGVPLAIKDLFWTRGVLTTSGSKILANFIPQEDSAVVERLKRAGAVIVGKTNMHEFGLGATNENIHYGDCRNPWDLERVSGGSSGGSAVAVTTSMCSGAIGSDSGGSIRLPSSFCGIVGLKPTFGRVSVFGAIPLSWSLDHGGPMAKSVEDIALMMNALAGYDPRDPASPDLPVPDYTRALVAGVKGLRLGIPWEYFFEDIDGEVHQAVTGAIGVLQGLGASSQDVSLPGAKYGRSIAWALMAAEGASYHERYFREKAELYCPDVRARLEIGQLVLATDYLRAQRARSTWQRECLEALKKVDLLLVPTSSVAAPKVGERRVEVEGRMADVATEIIRMTTPFNVSGLPALSLPCGFSSSGLPIGLQIVGRPFEEETVLRAASAYEAATDWGKRRPKL